MMPLFTDLGVRKVDGLWRERRFRFLHRGWPAVIVVITSLLTLACSTGSDAAVEDWSRDYVTTFERAWEAAADALRDIDFYLESEDSDRGRIRARSSVRRGHLESTLVVDFRRRDDRIRVDVMAQSPSLQEGRAPVQVSGIVRDFFHRLDSRLEGRAD